MHRLRRRLRRAVLVLTASVLWGSLGAASVAACDLTPPTLETADLVVTGTATERHDPAPLAFLFGSPDDLIRWTFRVDAQEKGAVGRRVTVVSPRDAVCGVTFVLGERYRILATTDGDGHAVVVAGGAEAMDAVPAIESVDDGPMGAILAVAVAAAAAGGIAWMLLRPRQPVVDEAATATALRHRRALERAQDMFDRAMATLNTSREVLAEAKDARLLAAPTEVVPPAATKAPRKRPRPKPRSTSPAPTPKPATKSGTKSSRKRVTKAGSKPAAKPATKRAARPTAKPAAKRATKPAAKRATEPAAKAAPKRAAA